jgi:hypothetical protein
MGTNLGHVRFLVLHIHEHALDTVTGAGLSAKRFGFRWSFGVSRNNKQSICVPVSNRIREVVVQALGHVNGCGDDGNFGAAGVGGFGYFSLAHFDESAPVFRSAFFGPSQ